ncbi:uncharacterized protein LOC143221916 [Lasioglossum baleicum]|uniref:uncharacterized protein LOC143221916 n=1 Tax=Lasioglossum baleicum TaxID=434251 RepID=UPI003FCCB088
MMLPIVIFVSALTALSTLTLAVPLTDVKNLNRNVIDTVVSPCSSNEACWELLPVEELHGNIPIQEDLPKIHIRREAVNVDPNTIIESWGENAPVIDKRAHTLLQNTKQNRNRLPKKDAVMSRSWGAGGMPFSVLYMNPPSLRGNYASTAQQQEMAKSNDASTPSAAHPDYRIALRNGASSQPRRYSIIPQLFIAYGWGPFGK